MSRLSDECNFCGKADEISMPNYGHHPGWGYVKASGDSKGSVADGLEYISFSLLHYVCRGCMAYFENMIRDYIKAEQLARDQKRLIKQTIGASTA